MTAFQLFFPVFFFIVLALLRVAITREVGQPRKCLACACLACLHFQLPSWTLLRSFYMIYSLRSARMLAINCYACVCAWLAAAWWM
jgi:uncharacterized membrane protein YoaK (UPF0700 family)